MRSKLLAEIIVASCFLLAPNVAKSQWSQLNSGTTENLNEVFFPVTDTGYVVGENGTVLKTTNGGLNWNYLNTGLTLDFHELYFITSKEGWVVGDSGSVCHTTDGGTSWNCSFLDSAAYITLGSVYALNSSVVFVGGSSNVSSGYIAKTNNAGTLWQQSYIEHYVWDANIKKIGMVNDSTGYAITRGYVLKTTDYGMNWYITDTASVHAGKMFQILEDLAFFPDNDTVYVCGWYGGYLGKTVNGGNTWQHNDDYQNYNLDFITPQTGYIGGWGHIHKTTDGGMSFTDASGGSDSLLYNIYSIDFTDEWTGYACGYGGMIIKTTNGGATGVQEYSNTETNIIIYPNPTNKQVRFSDKVNVQLMNAMGQIVADRKNVNSLDLSNQATGVYFITLTNNKGQVMQRSKIVRE